MRKIFHKIHLWLAIPLGLLVFVICLTGAILVFDSEISELISPERYFAKEVTRDPIPVLQLVDKVNSQLDSGTVSSVQVMSDPGRNYVVRSTGGGRVSIYVDPYTGEITGMSQRGGGFTGKVMQLHRWLLSRDIGKPIVGYTTLFFVFILITGMVIWWPKSRKQLKHRLKVKTKNGLQRFWMDTHTSVGMYVFIGLLVLSLTGLTYSFRWYSKAFYGAFGVELAERQGGGAHGGGNNQQGGTNQQGRGARGNRPQYDAGSGNDSVPHEGRRGGRGNRPRYAEEGSNDSIRQGEYRGRGGRPQHADGQVNSNDSVSSRGNSGRRGGRGEGAGAGSRQKAVNMRQWQAVLDKLKADNPDYRSISVQDGSATIVRDFTFGNSRASDRYTFDSRTGEITGSQLYKDQDKSVKIRGWVYSLHVGSWGGLFSKILTCIIALIGASLPITGYYIYYKKHRKKKKKIA